jgi:hypothetical protein
MGVSPEPGFPGLPRGGSPGAGRAKLRLSRGLQRDPALRRNLTESSSEPNAASNSAGMREKRLVRIMRGSWASLQSRKSWGVMFWGRAIREAPAQTELRPTCAEDI